MENNTAYGFTGSSLLVGKVQSSKFEVQGSRFLP
jgi:hypothetical protein